MAVKTSEIRSEPVFGLMYAGSAFLIWGLIPVYWTFAMIWAALAIYLTDSVIYYRRGR